MNYSFLPYFIITLSLAYLALRVFQQPDIFSKARPVFKRLRGPGITLFPQPLRWAKILALSFSLLTGISTMIIWPGRGYSAFFILILLTIGFCLEEITQLKLHELPAILSLLRQVLKSVQNQDDILGALGNVSLDLPAGKVKHRMKRTQTYISNRLPLEKCLLPLRGIHPILDQFVSEAKTYQNPTILEITLELLLQRATLQWQNIAHFRSWLVRASPLLLMSKSFIGGSILLGVAFLIHVHDPSLVHIIAIVIMAWVLGNFFPVRKILLLSSMGVLLFTSIGIVSTSPATQSFVRENIVERKEVSSFLVYEDLKIRTTFDFQECEISSGYTQGYVNLRIGPGMEFGVITTLPESTLLRVTSIDGDFYTTGIWRRVSTDDGIRGWIFAELCPLR